ncbi:HIT family protein [Fictibacillus barbaricus]|uniref:HIT family protein n=1 Tax=Fictibacillus barbaricus TaxID=182136 RepID=A0ABS2ZAE5_9BACL|nr:HIT family protein [Fictibacillus barbaricus]MBN3545159.1 HIT family protein [Fictibacillus barbaricus]GGB61237.1 HIT family protein [Fictibacillus barbaricus]
MSDKSCLICERIEMIKNGTNPYFVAELETGYVVIGDHQYFKGYSLFLSKQHKTELHFLEENVKNEFLIEMSKVAEAVYKAFNAEKLNYELLGNGDSHLHWHLFPRREKDSPVKGPVWWVERDDMFAEEVKPSAEELEDMKIRLHNELIKVTPLKNSFKKAGTLHD